MSTAKKIEFTVPSIVSMSNEEYHAHPAIGSSSLKHMLRSPAHYRYNQVNPSEPTAAMKLGTAIHEAILERETFDKNVRVMPKFEGKGSVAAKEEWRLLNTGKTQLSQSEYETVKGILTAVENNKLVHEKLLKAGKPEQSFFWQDADTGLVCKCRPDYLRDGHVIIDVKTTVDASLDGFPTQMTRFKYFVSAAMYLDGVSAVMGQNFDEFSIIAIEKEPPYAMNVFLLDEGAISAGRMLYKRALKRIKECKDSNFWPAYDEKVLTASIPAWGYPVEDID